MIKRVIKRLVYKVRQASKPDTQSTKPSFLEVGKGTVLNLNNIIPTQTPFENKILITVGNDCHISATFVLEGLNPKVIIGNNTYIGKSEFHCLNSIHIGSNVMISWGCTIIDNNAHPLDHMLRRKDMSDFLNGLKEGTQHYRKYKDWGKVNKDVVVIEDDSWISFNCIILKGVRIGKGAIVGAGSVVTKDVPDFTIVAGNPAVVIGKSH